MCACSGAHAMFSFNMVMFFSRPDQVRDYTPAAPSVGWVSLLTSEMPAVLLAQQPRKLTDGFSDHLAPRHPTHNYFHSARAPSERIAKNVHLSKNTHTEQAKQKSESVTSNQGFTGILLRKAVTQ